MSLSETLRKFRPEMLAVNIGRHASLDKALVKLEKLSDGLSEAEVLPTNETIEETVSALTVGHLPGKSAVKLVAMGGLMAVYRVPSGARLLDKFLNLIEEQRSTALIRCILIGYLRLAADDGELPSVLRRFVVRNGQALPKHWQKRVNEYGLLEKSVGRILAQKIVDPAEKRPAELMQDAGLRGILQASGFSVKVFFEVGRLLSLEFSSEKLDRFLLWAAPASVTNVLFEGRLKDYAAALLSAHVNQDPSRSDKEKIQRFLIGNFGDPRINQSAWLVVPETYRAVINRWLTSESFNLLLKIVSKSNDTKQWSDRQKFWSKYVKSGHISEAWVALGPEAVQVAKRINKSGQLDVHGSYGVLDRADIDKFHSVILMRFGDTVISEWTHSGKVRIYRKSNQRAPKLYDRRYSSSRIRDDERCNKYFVHNGDWQSRVERFLSLPGSSRSRPGSSDKAKIVSARPLAKSLNGRVGGQCQRCGELDKGDRLDANGVCPNCKGGFRVR